MAGCEGTCQGDLECVDIKTEMATIPRNTGLCDLEPDRHWKPPIGSSTIQEVLALQCPLERVTFLLAQQMFPVYAV